MLLWRSSWRHLCRHPWQILLSVIGIALGVAVVVSIELANQSALVSFEQSQEALSGRATHRIVASVGDIDAELLDRLAELDLPLSPVVEGPIFVLPEEEGGGQAGEWLRLVGVDPAAQSALSCAGCRAPISTLDLSTLRLGEIPLVVPEPPADGGGDGLQPGDVVQLRRDVRSHPARVVGFLDAGDTVPARALRGVLLTDLASAQRVLDMAGRVSRIDLLLPAVPEADAEERLAPARERLPEGLMLVPADRGAPAAREMTRAFRLNLTALGLLAMVCGLFLIYNTMTFSVVQRRRWMGLLRAVGTTRRELLRMVLGEAMVMGSLGTLLGLGMGIALASILLRLVARTIDDLYFGLRVTELVIEPWILIRGGLVGILGTVGASLLPAREATRSPVAAVMQRSHLERGVRGALPSLLAGGALAVVAGGTFLWLSEGLVASFGGLFVAILGSSCLAPPFLVLLGRSLARPLGLLFGGVGRLAARGVEGSLSRTAVATAALMIAVAVAVGVGLMVGSFRHTVIDWLGKTLVADVYVRSAVEGRRGEGTVPSRVVEALRSLPEVGRLHSVRHLRLEAGVEEPIHLMVVETDRSGFAAFQIIAPRPSVDLWAEFSRGGGVLVSEPFAFHRGVAPGQELVLPTERGELPFPVLATYVDYASDRGVVLMSRATFEGLWSDRGRSGVSLAAAEGIAPESLLERVGERLGSEPDLLVESRHGLREASLEVFDRTFAITGVLRLLVGLVAFVGILSGLMALQLERRRELGVLRANGLTPRQLRRMVMLQTGLLGLAAGLLALPVGAGLAAAMVYVINRRSFGWSMELFLDAGTLAQGLVLAVAAASLAGIYPGTKMARTSPSEALRQE